MQTLYKELALHYADIVSINTDTRADVEKLSGIFQKFRVHKVLDVGCGVGRHTAWLHQLGYKVVGLDYSENQIKNVVGDALFIVADANTDVFLSDSFDAAICMWSTLGEVPMDYKIVIRNVLKWLRPRGIFIIDNNCWNISSEWKSRSHEKIVDDKKIEIKLLDRFVSGYRLRYAQRIIDGKRYEDLCLTHIKTGKEWEEECVRGGFSRAESFDHQHVKQRVWTVAHK